MVTLPDAKGTPLAGTVQYTLERHAFPFGTAVNAKLLLSDPSTSPDVARDQQTLRTHFNFAVAENAHKWYSMERERGKLRDDEALAVWQRCREFGLPMRGHCVFWGVDDMVMPWVKQLSPPELEAAMHARLNHLLTLFQGKITDWDLNNEMMHQDYYARALGLKNGATYFAWATQAFPENRYYVNDYSIMGGDCS